MSNILIFNKYLILKEKIILFNEITNEKVVSDCNKLNLFSNNRSVFTNTIFYHDFINDYYSKCSILNENNGTIIFKEFGLNPFLFLGIGIEKNYKIKKNIFYFLNYLFFFNLSLFSKIKVVTYFFLSYFYIIIKSPWKIPKDKNLFNSIAFIHSKASLSRFKSIINKKELLVIFDNLNLKEDTMQKNCHQFTSYFGLLTKIEFIMLSPKILRAFLRELLLLTKEIKPIFPKAYRLHILNKYINRIMLTSYYDFVSNHFISECKTINTIYSGEKESRFAIIQNRICDNFGFKSVCIPHGLEYNINYPLGLFGNTFYATSQRAKEVLAKFYPQKKIIFDVDFMQKIFSRNKERKDQRKLVFFTDSRNIQLDYKIISFLSENFIKIYVKLHPNDLKDNYSMIKDVIFIDEFDDAITNNFVMSRNSTVLLEASFNYSIPISILLNEYDFFISSYLYPSLASEIVIKVSKLENLLNRVDLIKYLK
jgi:hypothetical protein